MAGVLTLADARTRLAILTTAPAATTGIPTVTEAAAGIYASPKINKPDYRLSPTASDTVPDQPLDHEGNAVTFGASNYEGSITALRFLDASTGKPDATDDSVYEALGTKGARVWLVERVGPKASVAFAASDIVNVYEVITDNPQAPQDRNGYVKNVIPLGVQTALLDVALGAGA